MTGPPHTFEDAISDVLSQTELGRCALVNTMGYNDELRGELQTLSVDYCIYCFG